ncbi:hypothetical protein LEP1GSC188_1223 [Leptospira weilii serovar Topaz str. LT2116]|uniref:Uncharacterized protein n=1 Tax=Leptospira weilii serovar Topaz str. LT2116 TaxID=1088540 RepID=M3GCJ2_9LEPT|nr:hypothetical protein LEP1GSC188_1223 [Leptospira weilii serovar Topaz str. LT2116]
MLKERNQTFKLIFTGLDFANALFSGMLAFVFRFYFLDENGTDRRYVDVESYIFLFLYWRSFRSLCSLRSISIIREGVFLL